MDVKGLTGRKENQCGFSFCNKPLPHKRAGSESGIKGTKSDSYRFLTLLSPRDSNTQETGPFSTRTISEASYQIPKYMSIISKLNEEIQILSTQLKESNEIISHFTQKLNEISLNFSALKEITDKLKIRNEELEKQNFSLNQKNKNLKQERGNLIKKLEIEKNQKIFKTEEKVQEQVLEQKTLNVLKENYYNEVIAKLNEQFLFGIDEVIGKFKGSSGGLDQDIREFKGFFSDECRTIIRKSFGKMKEI